MDKPAENLKSRGSRKSPKKNSDLRINEGPEVVAYLFK